MFNVKLPTVGKQKIIKICLFSSFILSVLVVGCKNDSRPSDVIPEEKMKNILTDLHLIESRSYRIPKDDSAKRVTKASYEFVFKKYGIDTAALSRSMKYYLNNPEIMDVMYEQMIDSLSKRQSELSKTDRPASIEKPFAGKTVNKKTINRDSLKRVRDSVFRKLDLKKHPVQ
ncbi:hypothetical protein D3C87_1705000 [compost metagenome]|uniref:DUF4296 domain-containing protein n=1 Tax=Solitalea canadensis (strain ATCC 29591 / DSM 3403 / JCM 21819 / LMG 8368 / NBRC 15130 / NCIMB 12057 / USAM 9D) TaxID=929556 RepID=H8KW59_SOLCM|nr:DUF4296 domain-containing protein [Solitalea canadensis]AFD07080.1 hypothetical protein Solca_2025 [Solitalea canadensis DSM 3403]